MTPTALVHESAVHRLCIVIWKLYRGYCQHAKASKETNSQIPCQTIRPPGVPGSRCFRCRKSGVQLDAGFCFATRILIPNSFTACGHKS